MSIDIAASCQAALDAEQPPVLAITLAVLFGVYVTLDSLLAASAIVRKATEAEVAAQSHGNA